MGAARVTYKKIKNRIASLLVKAERWQQRWDLARPESPELRQSDAWHVEAGCFWKDLAFCLKESLRWSAADLVAEG